MSYVLGPWAVLGVRAKWIKNSACPKRALIPWNENRQLRFFERGGVEERLFETPQRHRWSRHVIDHFHAKHMQCNCESGARIHSWWKCSQGNMFNASQNHISFDAECHIHSTIFPLTDSIYSQQVPLALLEWFSTRLPSRHSSGCGHFLPTPVSLTIYLISPV